MGTDQFLPSKRRTCQVQDQLENVHTFDKERRVTTTPAQFAGLICNVLVKLIGKWQTPDGSAMGLNLQGTDVQVLRAYELECPF